MRTKKSFIPVSYTHLDVYKRQQKRCRFLEHVIQELDLKEIEVLNLRAEDVAKNHREVFDCISARACLLYTSRCV